MKKVFNKFAYIRGYRKDVIASYKQKGEAMPKGADRLDAPTFKHITAMHGKTEEEIIKNFSQETFDGNAKPFMQKEEVVFRGQKRPERKPSVKKEIKKDSGVPKNTPFAELLKDYKFPGDGYKKTAKSKDKK